MSETVGIVLRTKDRPLLLKRAIESIENQVYADVSVVIIDEGKEHHVVEQLASASKITEKIKVIYHQKPLGPAAAANRGIDALNTSYVSFLDDDNSWSPEFLQRSVATLRYYEKRFSTLHAVASYSNQVYEHLDDNNFVHIDNVAGMPSNIPEGILSLPDMFHVPPLLNNALLLDLESVKSIGGFDEALTLLEDWDFHVRFASHYDIWVLPHVLAFNHLRPGEYGSYANVSAIDNNIAPHYYHYLCNRWLRAGVQGKKQLGMLAQLAPLAGQLHANTMATYQVLESFYSNGASPAHQLSSAVHEAYRLENAFTA